MLKVWFKLQGVFKGAESESEISFWVYTLIDRVVSLWCQETGLGYSRFTYGLKISDDIRRSLVGGKRWKIVHQWNRIRVEMLLFPVVCHFMDINHIITLCEPPDERQSSIAYMISGVIKKRVTFSPWEDCGQEVSRKDRFCFWDTMNY